MRPLDAWHTDLVTEYEALCVAVDRGEATFLDPYAAEDEAEFFAVASEEFIECAAELREAHPRVYALLREFYGIDPADWGMAPGASGAGAAGVGGASSARGTP